MLPPEEVFMIYSMWSGYLKSGINQKPEYVRLIELFPSRSSKTLHTSGHATNQTLAKLCNLVNPSTAIIPIHSECPEEYRNLDIPNELKSLITLTSVNKNGIDITI